MSAETVDNFTNFTLTINRRPGSGCSQLLGLPPQAGKGFGELFLVASPSIYWVMLKDGGGGGRFPCRPYME